jgi:hypothetical protein
MSGISHQAIKDQSAVDNLTARPRESGDPGAPIAGSEIVTLDSRLRGNERSMWRTAYSLSTVMPGLVPGIRG